MESFLLFLALRTADFVDWFSTSYSKIALVIAAGSLISWISLDLGLYPLPLVLFTGGGLAGIYLRKKQNEEKP